MTRRATLAAFVALAVLTATMTAQAAVPRFEKPNAVARAMERHYNSAAYKRRLDAANPGTRLTTRVLCAYEDYGKYIPGEVQCTGRMRVQRETDEKWVVIKAEWTLVKKTVTRAKLSWTFSGPGVFESDFEIVRPRDLGLKRF
jgi:hypothetical protein